MGWRLEQGDCLDVLPTLQADSIASIVTDPPAGIAFMHREWDSDKGGRNQWVAWMTKVMRECYRVLRPGGHMLVWAIPRTSHWTATAIEDAGFRVKDIVVHHYGSGFPKSMDIAKEIDRLGGLSAREQSARLRAMREKSGLTREEVAERVGCTPSSIRDWEEGRARRKGASVEHIIPSAEYREGLNSVLGYSADARHVVGDATDRRGDESVFGLGHSGLVYGDPSTNRACEWSGWGTALKPASEFWILAQKPVEGTIAGNVLEYGTGALNIDASRVDRASDDVPGWHKTGSYGRTEGFLGTETFKIRDMPPEEVQARCGSKGRFPPNLLLSHTETCEPGQCALGCPVAEIDRQSGMRKGGTYPAFRSGMGYGGGNGTRSEERIVLPDGGASRYFPTFRYVPKATRSERELGLDALPERTLNRVNPGGIEADPRWAPVQVKNHHPTLKSKALMEWLITLITPPKGCVLDPFTGSGSTGVAAIENGFSFYGIEKEPDFYQIAEARIEFAVAEKEGQMSLFDEDEL